MFFIALFPLQKSHACRRRRVPPRATATTLIALAARTQAKGFGQAVCSARTLVTALEHKQIDRARSERLLFRHIAEMARPGRRKSLARFATPSSYRPFY
jgi:hypothetical protein